MFLAPIFLAGLAAIGIPIFIHLMHSPKAKVVQFPTIRFLKACQKRAVRRSRLKNITLMMFRIALVSLIALAMAKPWRENENTSVLPNTPLTTVIVLDNSYSMGYIEKGRTRFDVALETAVQVVDTLRPGDEVAVLLANERAEPLVREFTTDHAQVKKALRAATISPMGTDLDSGLREAVRLARKAGAGKPTVRQNVQIVVLTDMQQSSWDTILKNDFLKNIGSDIHINLAGYGRSNSPNTYIHSVSVTSSGSGDATVGATVRTCGIGQMENLLSLTINGESVNQERFAADPMAPVSVSLVGRFDKPGVYRCSLAMQEDNLPLDDRYYFTVEVGDRASVIVVDGDPMTVRSLSETYYIGAALNPGQYVPAGVSAMDSRIVSAAQFSSATLESYRCIVLCNVPRLDGAELIKLENFLRDGGGILIFLGDKVDAQHYNQWSFLPIALTQPQGDKTRKDSFTMGQVKAQHPAFSEVLDLHIARFFFAYGSDPASLKKDATILISFSNGLPAIVEGRFGKGRVLIVASACDMDWNNFPLRRCFLPWLYRSIAYLAGQQTDSKSFLLNDKVVFQALASAYKSAITVTDPSGRQMTLRPEVKAGYAESIFTEARIPGLYDVLADSSFSNHGGFGVNVNRKESDLTMVLPEKVIASAAEGTLSYFDATQVDVVAELQRARQGEKLWPLFLRLAIIVFVLESILANFMSRTRKTSGPQVPLFDVLRKRRPGVESVVGVG